MLLVAAVALCTACSTMHAAPPSQGALGPGLQVFPIVQRSAAPQLDGTTITGDPLNRAFERGYGRVSINVWGSWCGPCRQVAPIVETIAAMRQGAYKVVKVNIDDEPTLAQQFQIQSIPMIGLFRNGRLERASLGAKPRQQIEAELGILVMP